MGTNLFEGKLVHLTAEEPETMAKAFTAWAANSEYLRLLDSGAARQFSAKKWKEWLEKDLEKEPPSFYGFALRTLDEQGRLIGFIGLEGNFFPHGEAFVGIGIGERQDWKNGYGTDAMQVILRYAFMELNLRRVTLNVFEYNPRAIRSYEKAGFRHEGRIRQYLNRDGQRWDILYMGILREEWMEQQGERE